ncbi:MAG: DUF2147 domain-containing protein [Balneola sp.]|nr:MAG: DUF2147 domain-containing protein [Balneola sp.]
MTQLLFLFISLFSISTFSTPDDGDQILGTWVNKEQTTHVEIYKKDGRYYGKIAWLPRTVDQDGNPITDRNNPDEELRDRELLGADILEGFEYEEGEWKGGTLYSPQNGQKVSPTLQINSDGELNMKVKKGLMKRTVTWTRL